MSLHRRFKRVPNEDSGKSSWWMLNDAPDQCPPARKRTVSVGKFERKDLLIDLAPPSTKIPHLVAEPLKTASRAGSSSANQPWSQTAQPVSGYASGVARSPELYQVKWHQPSTTSDPFFVADFDPAFANPNYTSTSCTPLAPISELLSRQQFTPYDLHAVANPSPPSYVSIQAVSGEQSLFSGQNLTALSSVKMLSAGSQPSMEAYSEAGQTSVDLPVVADSASVRTEGLQTQLTPGWSMLRQMLSQSHRENALMHGVVSDNPPSSASAAEYIHGSDGHPLQTALPFMSTSGATHHSLSCATLPQSVHASDVLYIPVSSDTDDTSLTQQPAEPCTEETEGSGQQQSGHSNVLTPADVNAPKTVEADNNNESVAEEEKGV